jgi:hypothetical protein
MQGYLTLKKVAVRLAAMAKRAGIIVFGQRDGDHVMIEPIPKVASGWRTVNISVRCGAWADHYAGQFLVGELSKFGKEIEYFCENLKPAAALKSVEHYLLMTLAGDGHGHVQLEGRACERLGSKTGLEFQFQMDRGTLPEIARSLIEADPLT